MKTTLVLFMFALIFAVGASAQGCVNGIPQCFGCSFPPSCYDCHSASNNQGNEWDVQTDQGWYCLCLCGNMPLVRSTLTTRVHNAPDFRGNPTSLNNVGQSFRNAIRNVTGIDLLSFMGPAKLSKQAEFMQVHSEVFSDEKYRAQACAQRTINKILASEFIKAR